MKLHFRIVIVSCFLGLLSVMLSGCGGGDAATTTTTTTATLRQYPGVCIFDVDRTLTCGNNLLEADCPSGHGHNCYSEQIDPKTGNHLQAYLYSDEQGQHMQPSGIKPLVAHQESECVLPESQTCFDRGYVWSPPYNSPKVDYQLRFSRNIKSVVEMCRSKSFAFAIATHGADDFTQVQKSCPVWDPNCSQPSSCKATKRCHAVKALHLEDIDPRLESDCDLETDFVQHDPHIPKGTMVAAILARLRAENEVDTKSTSFKVWFFDDEGTNRKSVAGQQTNFSSLLAPLGLQVETCAFSPSDWTKYQSDEEGWRGNNLSPGFNMTSVEHQISRPASWTEATSIGCKMSHSSIFE